MFGMVQRLSRRPWTESESAYLIANYETTPTMVIARALNRQHATIKVKADKLGLSNARRRVRAATRHQYFASIQTPVQAYLLGLLAADGSVSEARNEIRLEIKASDSQLLELARDELSPGRRLYDRADGRLGLRVYSAEMKHDLTALGVTPRKSLTLSWPPVPGSLAAPFICGCFDGDGSLSYYSSQGYWAWSLVSGSRPFLASVQEQVLAGCGVKLLGPYSSTRSRTFQLVYRGPKTPVIDAWLHADVAGLSRKTISGHPARGRLRART